MKHVQPRRMAARESLAKVDQYAQLTDRELDKVSGGAIDSFMYFQDYKAVPTLISE